MQVLCLYGPSQLLKVNLLRKQQYAVTIFNCNHLAEVIALWQMQNILCYYTVFSLFYFEFEGNFRVQAHGALYLEGRFIGGIFALRVWGAYIWRGLFSEFYAVTQRYSKHILPVHWPFIMSRFQMAAKWRKSAPDSE